MTSSLRGPRGPRIAGCSSSLSLLQIFRSVEGCSRRCSHANPAFNPQSRSVPGRVRSGGIRDFHHGKIHHFPSMGVLLDEKSRESFQTELERTDDIYSYLLRWQNDPTRPNIDPILPPELRQEDPARRNWIGNMLSEQSFQPSRQDYMAELEDPQHSAPTDYENTNFLRPGDVVEMKSNGSYTDGVLAVYVHTVEKQLQFYTSRGRWVAARRNDINILLNESIPFDYITPILPYFPTSTVEVAALPHFALEGGVPRPLATSLITLLLEFEQEANEFYTQHAPTLDDIHTVVADKYKDTILTLDEISRKALDVDFESLNSRQKYAIHKSLRRNGFYIIPNNTNYTIESYRFRSKKESNMIDTVVEWVRKYQNSYARDRQSDIDDNPLELFARKARNLVNRNRRSRTPTDSFCLGPSSQDAPEKASSSHIICSPDSKHTFDRKSEAIIKFLLLWILPPGHMNSGRLETTGSTILRATQMYEGYPLDLTTGYLFLQEIGVLSPWQNLHLLSEQLELPGHGLSPESDKLMGAATSKSAELTGKGLVDKMDSSRKDWGELPVFCVDSPGASEIDDGFSLEPVEGSPDTFWIRVHVANPSAFIEPNHEIAQAAAHFKQSLYAPESVYPMFPPTFTQKHFSLARGRPALTISSKVNMNGDILETDIVNSRVNNVLYITPEATQKLFGAEHSKLPSLDLRLPGTVDKKPPRPNLGKNSVPKKHEDTFHTMQKLFEARRAQRKAKGALDDDSQHRGSTPWVSMGGKSLPSWLKNGNVHRYEGEPTIQLSGILTDPLEVLDSTKHDLVSHAMLLAGEVAAQWCKDKGIPVVFSSTAYNPEDLVRSAQQDGSSAPTTTFPRSFSSPRPARHVSLGMDQYVKCTSPLRRYTDLLAHWQIEAYLRGEETLPFSEEEISKLISRSHWQNHLKVRAENHARDFWICQLFHRALNFNEVKLPETFQCLISTEVVPLMGQKRPSNEQRYLGSLLPFRMRCLLESTAEAEKFKPGDIVDVKVCSVNVYESLISADIVGLVKRPEEGTIPPRALLL